MAEFHDMLYEQAEKAIDKLFSDTSVSQGETKKSLKSLMDEIYMKMETLTEEP